MVRGAGSACHGRRGPGRDHVALLAGHALVLDFDGTITEVDLLDELAQRFGDPSVYREVEDALLARRITLQECITREFAPVRAPLDEVVKWVLSQVRVRPGFRELVASVGSRGWHVLVLSSGFHEVIEPVLAREGVAAEVQANRLDVRPDGWRVLWRDATVCAVCGEPCKRAGLPRGAEIVYVGDGYSDRCAALAASRVFATRGLAGFLDARDVPHEQFDDFFDVLQRLAR